MTSSTLPNICLYNFFTPPMTSSALPNICLIHVDFFVEGWIYSLVTQYLNSNFVTFNSNLLVSNDI